MSIFAAFLAGIVSVSVLDDIMKKQWGLVALGGCAIGWLLLIAIVHT